MDKRCPRGLSCMPNKWCELAVLRLKAIRNAGKELSEQEESMLPGCSFAIDHQLAHYCFFKYLSEYTQDRQVSDIELAALLNVSVETIRKIEKQAIAKMKNNIAMSQLKTSGGQIIDDEETEDYKIHR